MTRKWMRYSFAALALTLVAWGCDNVSDQKLTGPETGSSISANAGIVYKVVNEQAATAASVSAVIDAAGGKLVLGKHELVVPANAVSAPTTFVMSEIPDERLAVSLTATQSTTNDVGHAGFAVPVKLSLSFEAAASLPADLSVLRVIWLKEDGTLEVQASEVDVAGKRVSANLSHFSDYAAGYP